MEKGIEMANTLTELGKLEVIRKSGKERFRDGNRQLDFDLMSYWQWSASDLVSNVTRGVMAEYIVGRAFGIGSGGVREEWAAYDLITPSGIKVEVKSAAYVQSWHQNRLSKITFRTPKTLTWDSDSNRQSQKAKRQANVYVFALLAHQEKKTIDPLDVSQWEFYVLPTLILDARKRSQHSITLSTLQKLTGEPVGYNNLKSAVEQAAKRKSI